MNDSKMSTRLGRVSLITLVGVLGVTMNSASAASAEVSLEANQESTAEAIPPSASMEDAETIVLPQPVSVESAVQIMDQIDDNGQIDLVAPRLQFR